MNRKERIIRAAGYIDGEGCIMIVRQKHSSSAAGFYFTLRLQVGTNNRPWLNELSDLFGGVVKFRDNKYGGSWEWKISTNMAADALLELLPYLIEKKKQAQVAMRFASRRRKVIAADKRGQFVARTEKEIAADTRDHDELKALKRIRY